MGKILVHNGEKRRLRELFNCSYPTVKKALDNASDSLLSRKIRKAALSRGGMETNKPVIEEKS